MTDRPSTMPRRAAHVLQHGRQRVVPELGVIEATEEMCDPARRRIRGSSGRRDAATCARNSALPSSCRLGPSGNGLANPATSYALAAFEDVAATRAGGQVQANVTARMNHSPFDVVPDGNTRRRPTTASTPSAHHYDHPTVDLLVLHSATDRRGSVHRLVILAPRFGMVHLRPHGSTANLESESGPCMRRLRRQGDGLLPGGASLHNSMSGHGKTPRRSRSKYAPSASRRDGDTMAFMFETGQGQATATP